MLAENRHICVCTQSPGVHVQAVHSLRSNTSVLDKVESVLDGPAISAYHGNRLVSAVLSSDEAKTMYRGGKNCTPAWERVTRYTLASVPVDPSEILS